MTVFNTDLINIFIQPCKRFTCLEVSYLFILFTDEDSTSSLPGTKSASDSRTSTPEPHKMLYKDKKEAIDAFKELLKERVCNLFHIILQSWISIRD